MIKLGKWEHPTTGEVRVYMNGVTSDYGVKIFATESEWKVTSRDFISTAKKDELIDRADTILRDQFNQENTPNFEQLVAAAS